METWLILLAISFLLVCLILTVLVLICYSGSFEHIEVKAGKPPIGQVTIAYKFARGPYGEVGPLFFEVATIAPDNKAVGIYYDDPNKEERHRLRYVVACILAEDDQEVDPELVGRFEAEGFRTMVLPRVQYAVTAAFPYKSSLSIFIGSQKAYPSIVRYIEERGLQAHPMVEVYAGSTIHYMAPLEKQDQFYVPETQQAFPGEPPYDPIPPSSTEEPTTALGGGDSPLLTLETHKESPEEEGEESESLLHASQIVKAEVIGTVQNQPKEEEEEKEEEGESKESSPGLGGSVGTEEGGKKERGSDEESGSSFEDLKMEAEEGLEKPNTFLQ